MPFTASVNGRPPAIPPAGFKDLIVGTPGIGGMTVIPKSFDWTLPPPVAGVETVTLTGPELAISAAATAACNSVFETITVGRGLPFHKTTELNKKSVPSTVRLNAGVPAVIVPGVTDVMFGVDGGDGLVTVKAKALEATVVPLEPGFETTTLTEPAFAASAGPMAACNCVLEMKVV